MSTTQSRKRAAQDKQLTQLNMKVTSQEQHLTAQAKKLTVQAVEQIARGQKIKYTDLFNAELRLSQADLVESNKYLYCLNMNLINDVSPGLGQYSRRRSFCLYV